MAERELGDVATKVVFENERVKIWEMELPPGGRTAVHRHDMDYILVQLAGDRIRGEFEPDTAGQLSGVVEGDVQPGQVFYVTKGGIETAVNPGQETYREILIELKG
jgi:quercetin dioxygenase-like cupin family protein